MFDKLYSFKFIIIDCTSNIEKRRNIIEFNIFIQYVYRLLKCRQYIGDMFTALSTH